MRTAEYIGRIRYASERTPGVWLWNVNVTIPGPPFGSAKSLDQAKERFKEALLGFKHNHKHGRRRWPRRF